ncbi:MAG: hypothetical protein Kow0019_19430 [Methanobacteriaceae archaeon]
MNPRNFLKKIIIMVYIGFLKIFSIDERVIFFESSVGRNYSGNPKYVYEEMVSRGLDEDFRCVWSLEDTNTKIPGKAIKVQRARLKYLYYLSVAKFLVCDSRLPSFIVKRPDSIYIQLWHGTPLKKLAMDLDMLVVSDGMGLFEYKRLFKQNTQTWDYLISQSEYNSEKFRSCFDYNKEILEIGSPRNDILVNENTEMNISCLKCKYGIPKDKKVILYAPTWRDDQFYANKIYKYTSPLNLDLLKKKIGDTHIILIKLHYLVKDSIEWRKYKGFVYECGNDCDIQELYLISDILVTDYSSAMFDYAILERPMIIYAYDYEDYKNRLRGFYFNIFNHFPGPIVKNTPELADSIKKYDYNDYKEKYKKFLEKFTSFEKGKASSKIVDLILDNLNNDFR